VLESNYLLMTLIRVSVTRGVTKSYLYQMLCDYICMLRVGNKPMILITLNLAKTCLKVIKVSRCRLMNHLPLKALTCLEVDC
jgi:hypothetical protein